MSAINREATTNYLMNINYTDIKQLEKILQNFKKIEELSRFGYMAATDIVIDVKSAFNSGVLTKTQLFYIQEWHINGKTQQQIAMEIEENQTKISKECKKAMKILAQYFKNQEEDYK